MTGWKLAIVVLVALSCILVPNGKKIASWYYLEVGIKHYKDGIKAINSLPSASIAPSVTMTASAPFFENARIALEKNRQWSAGSDYANLVCGLMDTFDGKTSAQKYFDAYLGSAESDFAVPLRGILQYNGKPDINPFANLFAQEVPISPHSAIMAGWISFHRRDLELTCNLLLRAKSAKDLSSSYHYLKALTQIESGDLENGFLNLQKARTLSSTKNVIKNLGVDIDPFPVTFESKGNTLKVTRGPWIGKMIPYGKKIHRAKVEVLYGIALCYNLEKNYHRALFLSEIIKKNYGDHPEYSKLIPQLQQLSYPLGYNALVVNTANEYGLDPYYIFALIREESKFKVTAASNKAAQGLMQITPETGRWICQKMRKPYREGMLAIPATNISMGCWYVKYLLGKFADKNTRHKWTLAAYNAGLGNAERWMKRWKANGRRGSVVDYIRFQETKDYVTRVTDSWHKYTKLYGN